MHRLMDVMNFVMKAHLGQRDKTGQDYVLGHLMPVAQSVPDRLFAPALAHDILEDTKITSSDLYECGLFDPTEIDLIQILTKEEGYSYEEYVKNFRYVDDAVTIKLADIRNNLQPRRLAALDQATQKRLRAKYRRALIILHKLEEV